MLPHLFIDSIKSFLSQLQANVFGILTNNSKTSTKMQNLAMDLLNFKCEIFKSITQLVKNMEGQIISKKIAEISEILKSEISASSDKLFRYRLHHILKNKAAKKRRQSLLGSSFLNEEGQELTFLERSIVMIEKDLGIEDQNQQNQKLGISKIISKSKSISLGLDYTPISSKIKVSDYSMVSQAGSIQNSMVSNTVQSQLSESRTKENQHDNSKYIPSQPIDPTIVKKIATTKKKKVIISKIDAREGLLGNLLEETYNQCLDKK